MATMGAGVGNPEDFPANFFQAGAQSLKRDPTVDLLTRILFPSPAQGAGAMAARGEPSSLPASTGKRGPAIGFTQIPNMKFLGARGLLGPAATSRNPSMRSSQLLSEAGSTNTAAQMGAFAAKQLEPILNLFMSSLFGGSSGGFPSREDLLNPRLQDISSQETDAQTRLANIFAGLGRNVTATPAVKGRTDIGGAASKERQRATGEVDTLLAQLMTQRQNVMAQLMSALLGGFGGLTK